jgi:DNA-binding transcriptional ArsR family regulator
MPQWFRWKSVPNEPKPRKIPVHPSDPGCASSTDPATWGSFEDAQANVGKHGTCGLGFTFTKSDPFFGADLDNCVVNRVVTDRAKVIVAAFETYTEISPSGEGLHLIGRGSLNGHRGINRKTETGIELYDTGRYFTMTGAHLMGTPPEITDGQRALDALIATLDPPRPVTPPSRPRPQTSADHGRIVERARSYVPKMPPAISGQGGHEATFRVALALVKGFSLDAGTALDLLRDFNGRCEPPWSEKELVHKIEDAEKADVPDGYILERDEPKSPRSAPAPKSQTPGTPVQAKAKPNPQKPAQEERDETPADGPLSVVDLLRRVYVGARFSTGLADLNDLLKGGLAPGFLFVIGGEPWIGKTTLLVQIADALAAAGVVVFIWATDEPPEGLALRLGQLHGEEQGELNSEHPAVLETLRKALENGPRFLPESVRTVSEAVAFAKRHTADGKVAGILLDSLQSQAERNLDEDQAPRAALSALMGELNEAKKQGLIVGAASELSRGGYASQDPGQRTRGLAAFAESRAIEYRSDIAMTMVKASGTGEDLVRVEVLKNRLGHRKGGMTLRLDHARARLQSVDEEAVKRRDAEETRLADQEKRHAEEDRVLAVLNALAPEKVERGLSVDEIRDRARMNKRTVSESLARLADAGRVERFKPSREPGQMGPVPERFRAVHHVKAEGAA